MPVEVRRGADRSLSTGPGRRAAHSLSFGAAYDPANLSFGPVVAVNDERVEPGAGYPDHRHEDVEILTWVVVGVLTHRSPGVSRTVRPGQVQVQAAGPGTVHSETVAPGDPPTRFVQCWLRSDRPASYDLVDTPLGPGWTRLAGPDGPARLSSASAYAARLTGDPLRLPDADRSLLLVVGGRATLAAEGRVESLAEGDDARLTGVGRAEVAGAAADLLLLLLPRASPPPADR